MSVTQGSPGSAAVGERMLRVNPLRRLLVRPETGAVAGSIAVWIFFAVVAGNSGFLTIRGTSSYLSVAAELAIQAVPVALLMIGGEFDLSVGSTVGACGMIIALLSAQYGWSIWASIVVALIFAVLVGMMNGYLVMRTRLPSFIVTLGTSYILLGVTTGVTTLVANGLTVVSGIDQAPGYGVAKALFATKINFGVQDFSGFPIEILWALALVALATWLLLGTSFGNWIFGVGGDANAARNVGVPVKPLKIGLFMTTSFVAALTGVMIALRLASTQAGQGVGDEFQYIIAAVVGGCVLTGGFGSAIGASLGALIIGMAFIGIQFSGWNTDWRFLFLGVILLVAVLVNNYIRKRAEGARR